MSLEHQVPPRIQGLPSIPRMCCDQSSACQDRWSQAWALAGRPWSPRLPGASLEGTKAEKNLEKRLSTPPVPRPPPPPASRVGQRAGSPTARDR